MLGCKGLGRSRAGAWAAIVPALIACAPFHARAQQTAADIADLSLEELGEIKVTSVSKKAEPLITAPAAIYVVSGEDIRRAGANELPDMIRLAPNLDSAKTSARTYAITARGFAIASPNKLLVMIDGRTIYSPLHSAVFWDSQDVMPEDVDRIEVISGPGGTLWGANAVNGVINVVSRKAADTQGAVATVGAGPDERGGRFRYGGRINDDAAYRFYVKGFERGVTTNAAGASLGDDWNRMQGGFRMDWDRGTDTVTVQGDMYGGVIVAGNSRLAGHNLVTRWGHTFESAGQLDVQAYYDKTDRQVPGSIGDKVSTYDIEAKHSFAVGAWNDIVWGGGYRLADGTFSNVPTVFVLPANRTMSIANAFVEDKITLTDRLTAAAGVKWERSSYSGAEILPSVRIAWQFRDDMLLWAAASRAVRAPGRVDRDFSSLPLLVAGPNFEAETLAAYEGGWRGQFSSRAYLSVSGYYNVYDDLRSLERSVATIFPVHPGNGFEARTYGVEVWGNLLLADWWRVSAGFTAMESDFRVKPNSRDVGGPQQLGNDPGNTFQARSYLNLPNGFEADVAVRQVASRPLPSVPAYVTADLRLGWRPDDTWEFALNAANLFDEGHPEFGTLPNRSMVPRSVYGSVTLRW